MKALAKELIGLQPNVIVGYTTSPVVSLRKETVTIPIVFVAASDPVGADFIADLAHPGGNMTGFINNESSMTGKWAELIKEMAPGISRIAFLFNPETAAYVTRYYQGSLEACARSFGMQPHANPVHSAREIESAITAIGSDPGGGLIVMPDSFNILHRRQIVELTARYRVPAISPYRFAVLDGGLMSYGLTRLICFGAQLAMSIGSFEAPKQRSSQRRRRPSSS